MIGKRTHLIYLKQNKLLSDLYLNCIKYFNDLKTKKLHSFLNTIL